MDRDNAPPPTTPRWARWHARWGWSGWIGLALAVFGLLIVAIPHDPLVQPESSEPAVEARQFAGSRDSSASASGHVRSSLPAGAASSPTDLAWRTYPDSALDVIGVIQRAANAHQIDLPEAAFQIEPITERRPEALEIAVRLRTTYPQCRDWLEDVRAAVPGLSIREFDASRADVRAPEVDVRLRLAVLWADQASLADRGRR